MNVTITDPTLIDQLRQANDTVTFQTPDGQVVAVMTVGNPGRLPPGVKSPFTDEQRAEMRKERTGRPLSDILRDLGARK